ncbi:MAG: lmo0937 family membrane protein [Candidatus Acidiferrales bacterium]
MLAAIGAVLLVLWLLGFVAFHMTFGAIHLLLVVAAVLFLAHLLTGRSVAI